MRDRLTQEFVAELAVDGRDRLVFEGRLPGFGVRVTPAGAKIFVAQARVDGRLCRLPVGRFPAMSVTDARTEAESMLRDMKAGRDPKIERVARVKAIEAGATTVAMLAERWLNEYVRPKLKPRTVADYEWLIEHKIKPALGHLIAARVAKEDVVKFHVEMRATPRRANYTVATFRALMTFAEDCGLRPPLSNPARKIKMYRERPRERFLSEAEIGQAADGISKAEEEGKIGPHGAAGLRLAIFTGARSGEITAIEWPHIDWSRRLARLPDSKTNEPRTIHLSNAAIEVLKETPRVGKFVIAGAKPGEPYKNLTRAWIIARKYAGLDGVRLHDLRHSYASLAAGCGFTLQMIGKLLGHRVPATTQRYAHLARDAVADVNDQLGAAITAAISKRQQPKRSAIVADIAAARRRKDGPSR
jgi:integrase